MKGIACLLIMVVSLSGCAMSNPGTKAQSGSNLSTAIAAAGTCDDNLAAFIPANGVGPARLFGSKAVRGRMIRNPADFVTICDVPLTLHPAHDASCGENVSFRGRRMTITRAGINYEMTITSTVDARDSYTVRMNAGREGNAVDSGADYLVGEYDKKKYFVYFGDSSSEPEDADLPLWKVYWIQVYALKPGSTTDYLCEPHMPVHAVNAATRAGRQAGTGGGVEPGRR